MLLKSSSLVRLMASAVLAKKRMKAFCRCYVLWQVCCTWKRKKFCSLLKEIHLFAYATALSRYIPISGTSPSWSLPTEIGKLVVDFALGAFVLSESILGVGHGCVYSILAGGSKELMLYFTLQHALR